MFFSIFSDNRHLDKTNKTNPTPIVTENFAFVLSDMCSDV